MIHKVWVQLIRFGFRLLYNELAWSYDLVSWMVSLGAWRAWQRAALPYLTGKRILEIGHGPGHMLVALQERGQTVTGLDLSPFMGSLARRRLRQSGQSAPLVQSMAQTLPFAAVSFDSVLATFPTDFVFEPDTLTAIKRVLVENGRFVIVPSGYLTGSNPIHLGIEWLYRITGQRSGSFEIENHQPRQNETSGEQFKTLFTNAGFRLQIHHIDLDKSGVMVMVAVKK